VGSVENKKKIELAWRHTRWEDKMSALPNKHSANIAKSYLKTVIKGHMIKHLAKEM